MLGELWGSDIGGQRRYWGSPGLLARLLPLEGPWKGSTEAGVCHPLPGLWIAPSHHCTHVPANLASRGSCGRSASSVFPGPSSTLAPQEREFLQGRGTTKVDTRQFSQEMDQKASLGLACSNKLSTQRMQMAPSGPNLGHPPPGRGGPISPSHLPLKIPLRNTAPFYTPNLAPSHPTACNYKPASNTQRLCLTALCLQPGTQVPSHTPLAALLPMHAATATRRGHKL